MTRSLAEDLAAKEPDKFCNFRKVVEGMPGDERLAVIGELQKIHAERKFTKRPYHSANRLSRILNEHGYIISKDVINTHLGGQCSCTGEQVRLELETPEEPDDTE